MSTDAPNTQAAPARALTGAGALVFVALFVVLFGGIWYAQSWLRSSSDEWALATSRRVLQEAHLAADERAGLLSGVERLEVALAAGDVTYDGFFACIQRLVEGTLVVSAEAQQHARDLAAEPPAATAYRRLARALHEETFPPLAATQLLESLRAPGEPAAGESARDRAQEAAALADLANVPADPWTFDPVAEFGALVDDALAGSPPAKLPQR